MTEIIIKLNNLDDSILEVTNKDSKINLSLVNLNPCYIDSYRTECAPSGIKNIPIITSNLICKQTDFIDFCHACIKAYDE